MVQIVRFPMIILNWKTTKKERPKGRFFRLSIKKAVKMPLRPIDRGFAPFYRTRLVKRDLFNLSLDLCDK